MWTQRRWVHGNLLEEDVFISLYLQPRGWMLPLHNWILLKMSITTLHVENGIIFPVEHITSVSDAILLFHPRYKWLSVFSNSKYITCMCWFVHFVYVLQLQPRCKCILTFSHFIVCCIVYWWLQRPVLLFYLPRKKNYANN